MHRLRRVLQAAALTALAALAVSALAGGARADGVYPTLYVNYTMSCTFGITDDSGKPVSSIAPGTYQVLVASPTAFAQVDLGGVNDMTACKGSVHFQLNGPGVGLSTTLDDGGSDTALLQVTFLPSSTYVAQDVTPGASRRVTFTTTVEPTSPKPNATTAPAGRPAVPPAVQPTVPMRGMLEATIDGAGKVSLSFGGRMVSTLRWGRYVIGLDDRSKTGGLVLQQPHGPATTLSTAAFTGRRRVAVDLTRGRWVYYPSAGARKTSFVVTS
jgi:hypothetical protein